MKMKLDPDQERCGWMALVAVAALALVSSCGKSEPPPAAGDHAHHAGAEAQAHTETRDGVVLCTEHDVPETACAVCRPEWAARLRPGESLQLRLPSTNSIDLLGVQMATTEAGAIADAIECVAEISYNQNQLAHIAAPVAGIIESVDVDLGTVVKEQQRVATIWSASIAEAVAKAVHSHQTLDRERKLFAERVTSEASLQEAEATHRAACQQLRTFGFTEAQIDEMGQQPQERVLMDVRAPFTGEIVERAAVRGALVEVGRSLFTLADRNTMWGMLQVPEAALGRVELGQTVELRVDSFPGRVFAGRVTWVGPAVDERTRLGRVRAEFANPRGLLKDKMFATARIVTRAADGALLVPRSAIQYLEGRPFVFVKRADDLFDVRAVTLGAHSAAQFEVLDGLKPQEPFARNHTFALKSAMLMSRLGAGCADD